MTVIRPISPTLRWAVALALGLSLAACGKKEEAAPAATPAAAAPAGPSAAEQEAQAAAQQKAAALAAMSAEELKKRGGDALREQRLYAPAGDNAMEYYIALRKKSEKPDASAESALIDLQPYAVIAAEQAIGREDFIEADRLRNLIATADPQAPALPRIADAIEKGKDAAAQRAAQEAARAVQLAKAAEEAKARAAQAAQEQAAPAAAPVTAPKPAAPPPVAAQPKPAAATPATQPEPAEAAPPPPPRPVVNALVPVSTPQPNYPPEAQRSGTTGEVVVSITIDTDGSVSSVDIVSAKPRGVFERNVLKVVRNWKFQPIQTQQTIQRTFTFSR